MKGKKTWVLLLLAVILGMTAGCTGADTEGEPKKNGESPAAVGNGSSDSSMFPRTVKHMNGETVVKAKPVKIATPYIGFVDYLAVLDEYPIAAQGVTTIIRNFPNLSKRLEGKKIVDLGTESDMEKLLAAQPDLIIAANDMAEQYEKLSAIAPTVIFPQAGNWRETLLQIAAVIGKEEKAKSVLADFDAKSAAYKTKLVPHSEEPVLFAMYSGKDQFVTWETERFEPFYIGLGLKTVQGAEKGGQLTLESLAALNPDHLFVINNWQNPVQGGVKEALKDSKVWNSMNAVKNDRVYYLEDPSLPGPMALAKIDGIEEIMKAMGK